MAAKSSAVSAPTETSDICERSSATTPNDLKHLYETQRYKECYDNALSSYAFDDLAAQCYLSQCAQKIGHNTMAIGALERILILQPDNIEAILELTDIYHRLGLTKQRDLTAASLKAYQLTPAQRTQLATLVSTKTEKLSAFSARLSTGGGYDTNLNILPTEEKIGSAYARVNLNMSFVHDLIDAGGWLINGNINYLHQTNKSAHLFDMDLFSASAGVGYKLNNFSISVPLYYRRLFYLESDLVQEFGLKPSVDIMLSKSFILNLNSALIKRQFLTPTEEGKNFEMFGGGIGGIWLFNGNFIYLTAQYKHFTGTKNQPTIFTAKDNYIFSTGGNYLLSPMLRIHSRYRYRANHFDDFYEQNNRRQDTNHALTLGIDFILSEHWKIIPLYRYIANLSNYAPATYHKQVSELSLEYNY